MSNRYIIMVVTFSSFLNQTSPFLYADTLQPTLGHWLCHRIRGSALVFMNIQAAVLSFTLVDHSVCYELFLQSYSRAFEQSFLE